jgi:peptidoglycan lytic transglycosylase
MTSIRHTTYGVIVMLLCFLFCGAALATGEESKPLDRQRALYKNAKTALAAGQLVRFRQLKDQLQAYPLHPYLEYAELSLNLSSAHPDKVRSLLESYSDIAFTTQLRQRWLESLASKRRWQQFISDYREDMATTKLQCQYSYGLYQTGNKIAAIEKALTLWQVGKSQDNACDPIFAILVDHKLISDQAAWTRFTLATFNHQYGIARYARKFISDPNLQEKADLYTQVDINPRVLADYNALNENSQEEREIIVHGLTHLAATDPVSALNHWNHYQQSHQFAPKQSTGVIAALVKGLYVSGHEGKSEDYLIENRAQADDTLLEWRLRELVKRADWAGIVRWRKSLAERVDDDKRWLYWYARSLELSGIQAPEERRDIYQIIAGERSFYGFLASEWLNVPYNFNHEPVQISQDEVVAMASSDAFIRIRELHHHNELVWARREWQKALQGEPQQSWLVAAKIADQWQWHNQAIMTMIQTGYWNDIELRFPRHQQRAFHRQAQATGIPVNLLLALSRQESAFNDSVTSPAGARGLMQLMPATAKETARRHNIRYGSPSELFEPEKNIIIGSRYYKEMLMRFNNNRILATAAYNAGPGRVRQWQQRSQGSLPFDAWIETIPFNETRNYVQNVLAFSIIYAHHLEQDLDILSPHEKNTLL